MKILWLKTGPLYPLDTGGKKRTHNMLCEIARSHRVTYLALRDETMPLHPDEASAPYAEEKIWIPWSEVPRRSLRFPLSLLLNLLVSTKPYSLAKYQSPAFARAIDNLCTERQFDLIVCDFLYPAVNLRDLATKPPSVLFQHNMEAQIWSRMAEQKGSALARWYFRKQFQRMARWEAHLSRLFHQVITVSPEDTSYARRNYGLTNIVGDVPTGVDTEYFTPATGKSRNETFTIGFLGSMDWMPNIEAIHWFADAILPTIRRSLPSTRLLVIGRRPPRSILALGATDPAIEVTGTVEDVRPYLARCDLLVVPLLSGGGTRIKIMEALAAGLPVVSTAIGAEGLGLVDGRHILIADTPQTFADAVLALAQDPARRDALAAEGTSLVRASFSWGAASGTFLGLCRSSLGSSVSPSSETD